MARRWFSAAVVAAVVVTSAAAGGCKSKDEAKAQEVSSAGGAGLDDPSVDKVVADAARAAIACEWSAGGGLKYDCPAHKAWKEAAYLKEGAADPSLTTMLADTREQVRWLAAEALSNQGKAYTKNAALAAKVVAAAQAETSSAVASSIGRATAKIDLATTGQQPAVEAMVRSHALVELRRALAQHLLWSNKQLFDLTMQLARTDTVPAVRKAAISAPWTGTPNGRENDACALWLEKVDDPADEVNGEAAYLAAFWSRGGGCRTQWDALLGKIEARARGGKVQSSQMASALGYFHGQKLATPPQRQRAIAIAKTIVETTGNAGMARGSALRVVGERDAGAKAFAQRFTNDKEFFVKSAAKDVVEGKIKPK